MGNPLGDMIIRVGMNSTSFDKGMTGLKRQMKRVNKEMYASMQVHGKHNKSVDTMGAKLDGLKKKREVQNEILKQSREEYQKLIKDADADIDSIHKAEMAVNDNVEALAYLEHQIKLTSSELDKLETKQDIQANGWHKAGSAIEGVSEKLGTVSGKIKDVGSKLTKSITLPALGAISAVGGMTAAFGWKRLVALDEAQAQLKGLGYSTEEVGRISDTVTSAVKGGMTTMAEGTAIAAGALAAGVDEGKDLEKYIKLVGDAAVGANRPVNEMSQIFNRVQGSGKLMTEELNMIEHGLPGFAQAMADELAGGSLESFREMVTNGEVGSEEFLNVMEGFAGGMASAYADSWSGMVANTKANVGIIGENLLGGVFEKSKESINEFLDLLRSDDVQEWATKTGEKIGESFNKIVDKVKGAINWYNQLDESKQKLILKAGAFAVAIGPVLTILGTLGGVVSKVLLPVSKLFKWLGKTQVLGLFGKTVGKTGKSVGLFGKVFGLITNPIGIAIGVIGLLAGAFTLAYNKSETFRNFIHNLGEKIKEVFSKFSEWIQPAIEAVTGFFNNMKEKILEFWETDGQQLIEAFQNIWNFVSPILTFLGELVVTVFKLIGEIIGWVMQKIVLPIIKTVWSAIESIISGTLDIILGVVKIFSGLFTGDFSKMWEGVKQIFEGAIGIVWGFVKDSFVGRIITNIINFVKNFKGNIEDLWEVVKRKFKAKINEVFNNLKNSFIGRIITNIINFSKNFKENISKMWQRIKSNFDNKISEIRRMISNSFVGRMLKSVKNLKKNFVRLAKEMWQGVKDQFTNIVDGAKNLPKRIGKGIKNGKDKAVNGMKSVGNSIIKWAGKPFNKVVDGVNWITGKLGIKTKIGKWDYPQYAKGTKKDGHPGGIAMVGEEGQELVKLPDGRSFLTPNSHTIMNLPRGTHVIPNNPTEKIIRGKLNHIPAYAKGTGLWEGIKNVGSKVKGGLKKAWETVGNVWDYATNPSKLVNKITEKIGIKDGMSQIPKKIVTNGFNYVKSKPVQYVKDMFKKAEEEGNNLTKPNFGGRFTFTSPFGMRWGRLHGGVDYGAPTGTPIPSQSSGRVSYASNGFNGGFGNLVKVRQGAYEHFYAHMSRIIARAGQSVSKGQTLGLVGSTGNSTGPHVHYEIRKNGRRLNPMRVGGLKGFATGGLIKKKQIAMLGEEGQEMVIPLERNRRTEAMKLLALASKMISNDTNSSTRPNSLPNISTNNQELELLKEQNQLMLQQLQGQQQQLSILTQILAKDTDIYLDSDKVGKGVSNRVTKQQTNRTKMDLAKLGVIY